MEITPIVSPQILLDELLRRRARLKKIGLKWGKISRDHADWNAEMAKTLKLKMAQ
jgi:hypothetical protein